MIIDAQGAEFRFNNEIVGKITQYEIADGSVASVEFNSISSSATEYYPGKPDLGFVRLTLYRSTSDAGQEEMQANRESPALVPCSLKLKDGRILTFQGFAQSLPISGLIDNVNTSTAVVKIHKGVTIS